MKTATLCVALLLSPCIAFNKQEEEEDGEDEKNEIIHRVKVLLSEIRDLKNVRDISDGGGNSGNSSSEGDDDDVNMVVLGAGAGEGGKKVRFNCNRI